MGRRRCLQTEFPPGQPRQRRAPSTRSKACRLPATARRKLIRVRFDVVSLVFQQHKAPTWLDTATRHITPALPRSSCPGLPQGLRSAPRRLPVLALSTSKSPASCQHIEARVCGVGDGVDSTEPGTTDANAMSAGKLRPPFFTHVVGRRPRQLVILAHVGKMGGARGGHCVPRFNRRSHGQEGGRVVRQGQTNIASVSGPTRPSKENSPSCCIRMALASGAVQSATHVPFPPSSHPSCRPTTPSPQVPVTSPESSASTSRLQPPSPPDWVLSILCHQKEIFNV